MLASLPSRMTVDQFLAWEMLQDEKWELVDGQPVLRETRMMAGGSPRHALMAANIIIALGPRLRGGPCRAYTSDLKVRSQDAVRYPDVTVDCGTAPDAKAAQTPRVLFEVLSPANSTFQQTRLLADYQAIDSVEQVVFVSQDSVEAQCWRRVANGWTLEDFSALDQTITLDSLNTALPLNEIYEAVVFDAHADTSSPSA